MIVGIFFVVLLASLVGSIIYGRRIARTEVSDAVFGNPSRTDNSWHWVIAGVASVLIVWFYFSWDAARSYFPDAGNELCQVAKLQRAVTPIQARFPGGERRLLLGTELLMRDYRQIDRLEAELRTTDFFDADRSELVAIIAQMRAALAMQADPSIVDAKAGLEFESIATRISQLAADIASPGYPGTRDAAAHLEALAQPGWGTTSVELPALPLTERGRKFDQASLVMAKIAKDFVRIRNVNSVVAEQLNTLKTRYKAFQISEAGTPERVAARRELLRDIDKIYKRIDGGKIFPPAMTAKIEAALKTLYRVQLQQQGSLR